MNDRRKKIAKFYDKEINTDKKIPFNSGCSYHLYWILVKNRDYLLKKMNEKNVEVGIHYKPIHIMKLYNNKTKLPVTENAGSSIITIPIHPNLTQDNLTEIVKLVNKYAKF